MGQQSFRQREPSSVQSNPLQRHSSLRNIVFMMDLEPLPEDLLLSILSFVPAKDLVLHCRCVSQRWKYLIDSPTVWRMKVERDNRKDMLQLAEMCHRVPWPRLIIKKPFYRNLVRNPCGTEQLKHWKVKHGGDGWVVENNQSELEGAESQTCFVTSFIGSQGWILDGKYISPYYGLWSQLYSGWCEKSQIVDLVEEGLTKHFLDDHQPVICISDWYAGRHDCGFTYALKVQLLGSDRSTVIDEFAENPEPLPQWNDTKYTQVYHEFRGYRRGVRYVKFTHKGKDMQFWKGWYGARITNSSVIVKCSNIEPCFS